MAFFKLLSFAALVAVSSAAPQTLVRTAAVPTFLNAGLTQTVSHVSHAAPVARTVVSHAAPVVRTSYAAPVVHEEVIEQPANYNFGYSVNDATTGDSKNSEEHSENGVTSGSYTVADPDGRIRTVTYTADEDGFQADVTYDGEHGPVAIPFDAPARINTASYAAPAVVRTVAAAAPAVVRTVAAPAAVHASHSSVVHNAPAVVRTIAQPAVHEVRTIAQPAAVHAVRTFAQPAVHEVRTIAQPAAVHASHSSVVHNAPAVVRTIAQPAFHTVQAAPAFNQVHTVAAAPLVRSFPATHTLLHA